MGKGKLVFIVLGVVVLIAIVLMASGSNKPIRLEKANIYSVSDSGHTLCTVCLEFWNATDKPIESFKGQAIIYDKSNSERVARRCDIDWKSPIKPNEKLSLFRMYMDDVVQQEATGSTPEMIKVMEAVTKSMQVPVAATRVHKFDFQVEQVVQSK